jgi:YtkA-like protein
MATRTGLRLLPAVLLAACSSSGATSFPLRLESESGALSITLAPASGAPTVGTGSFEMTVTGPDGGAPPDGLDIQVVPWMPAMGHGTAPATVSSMGGGKYLLGDVYLFMPGTWELEISFSGAVTDHADPTFEIQ